MKGSFLEVLDSRTKCIVCVFSPPAPQSWEYQWRGLFTTQMNITTFTITTAGTLKSLFLFQYHNLLTGWPVNKHTVKLWNSMCYMIKMTQWYCVQICCKAPGEANLTTYKTFNTIHLQNILWKWLAQRADKNISP